MSAFLPYVASSEAFIQSASFNDNLCARSDVVDAWRERRQIAGSRNNVCCHIHRGIEVEWADSCAPTAPIIQERNNYGLI